MKSVLKEYLKVLLEIDDYNPIYKPADEEADLEKEDKKKLIKRNATSNSWRDNEDMSFEDQVKELKSQPEYRDLQTFIQNKLDNDEYEYTAAELQAVARNVDYIERKLKNALPPIELVKKIKIELNDIGFKFVPREAVRFFRGSMASSHGSHPFAGSGGGGSGFSDMGLGIGGGSGVISTTPGTFTSKIVKKK